METLLAERTADLYIIRARILRPHRMQRLSGRELGQMTRLMATMASSGMSLAQIIEQLTSQAGTSRERNLLAAMTLDLQAGHGIHMAALRRNVFSPMYLSVLKACEEGADASRLLTLLADTLEKNSLFVRRLAGAAVYPVILLLAGIAALWLMAVWVVPSMRLVLKDMELPALTQTIFAVSDALKSWQPGYGTLLICAGLILFFHRRRMALSGLLQRFPVVRQMQLAQTASVLHLLVCGQVPVVRALLVAAEGCGAHLASALRAIGDEVEGGAELSTAFANSPHLPPLWGRLTAAGEASGNYDQSFAMLAGLHERSVDRQMALLTRIAEPALVLFTGTLLTLVLLGLYLPVLQAGTAF